VSPTNVDVADRLGVSPAAVSRFRGGSRVPRMATQKAIAEAYGWSIRDQATAAAEGRYGEAFEAALCAPRELLPT
jgi:transcriptional regulator with XRE-family HTH domain